MGDIRFSCPPELVRSLAVAGGIDAAIETGTFRAEGALILRQAVARVWTIELDEQLHARAVARYGDRPGITFLKGSSDEQLRKLTDEVDEPVIFWLDAHGGMPDYLGEKLRGVAGDAAQPCPLIAELRTVREFRHVRSSCVLIDDARGFLEPHTTNTSEAYWPSAPSLVDIVDLLRLDAHRYITILDDVIMAVPKELRPVIDKWWLDQVCDREGRDAHQQLVWEANNPKPGRAARLLVKSVTPAFVRRAYSKYEQRQ